MTTQHATKETEVKGSLHPLPMPTAYDSQQLLNLCLPNFQT